MTNFWNTTGMSASAGMFWLHVHWFFGAFALIGLILLTVWALRSLPEGQLKTVTIWLLIIGVVGSLVTVPLAMVGGSWFFSQRHGGHMKDGSMMMGRQGMQMMHEMMEHEGGEASEENGEREAMEEMMRGMVR